MFEKKRKGATDLVHVEDEIELAHILEALVERLDQHLDEVEDAQLGLGRVDAEHEVQGGVVPVDQLVVGAADQTVVAEGGHESLRKGGE